MFCCHLSCLYRPPEAAVVELVCAHCFPIASNSHFGRGGVLFLMMSYLTAEYIYRRRNALRLSTQPPMLLKSRNHMTALPCAFCQTMPVGTCAWWTWSVTIRHQLVCGPRQMLLLSVGAGPRAGRPERLLPRLNAMPFNMALTLEHLPKWQSFPQCLEEIPHITSGTPLMRGIYWSMGPTAHVSTKDSEKAQKCWTFHASRRNTV